MSMAVTYTVFNGMVVHENRAGVERDYMPDTLGSTAALLDSIQDKTDAWTYWPYGEVAARMGSSETNLQYVGTYGNYGELVLNNLAYIRARFYRPSFAQWNSVDRRWPFILNAYSYANNKPLRFIDVNGESAILPFFIPLEKGGCTVYHCNRKGFLRHAWICVEGPNRGCSGDAQPGWPMKRDRILKDQGDNCTMDPDSYDCVPISRDCAYAGQVCECLWKMPFNYWLGGFCYGYAAAIECCGCDVYKGKPNYSNEYCKCINENCPPELSPWPSPGAPAPSRFWIGPGTNPYPLV